jgi:hypothetical protein
MNVLLGEPSKPAVSRRTGRQEQLLPCVDRCRGLKVQSMTVGKTPGGRVRVTMGTDRIHRPPSVQHEIIDRIPVLILDAIVHVPDSGQERSGTVRGLYEQIVGNVRTLPNATVIDLFRIEQWDVKSTTIFIDDITLFHVNTGKET